MDTMTLTLNHASVPAVLYGFPSLRSGSASTARAAARRRPSPSPRWSASKGWQVLAIDLPGHGHGPAGRSSSPLARCP